MDKHTKGKLVVDTPNEQSNGHAFGPHSESGYVIADVFNDAEKIKRQAKANARRLVACWNACDGIGTDELEKIEVKRNMRVAATEYAALSAQRDRLQALNAELVAALEIIARGDADRGLQMRDIARAALAKAKEAQS